MKSLHWLMVLSLLLAACGSPEQPPAAATDPNAFTPKPFGNLAQVMRTIPFPNSNIVFDTQSQDPDKKKEEAEANSAGGATADYSNVYGGWPGVEASALALAETANLIMIPGRLCENGKPVPLDDADYKAAAQKMIDAAQVAYMAAQTKNLDTMVDASGTISEACDSCHSVYRDKDDNADRCTPMAAAAAGTQATPPRSWFEWVDAFPSSVAIRESSYLYPGLLTTHVVSVCVFAGLIIMMDLRLLGVGNRRTPLSQVQKRLFPWQMAGMALGFTSGMLLFYAQPMRFYGNVFFWTKMVMMVLAGVNAMSFHRLTYRSVAAWDGDVAPPFGAKLSGAVSLAMWACVVISGRLIAYNWFTI